jgi:transcription elongation factor Elf1
MKYEFKVRRAKKEASVKINREARITKEKLVLEAELVQIEVDIKISNDEIDIYNANVDDYNDKMEMKRLSIKEDCTKPYLQYMRDVYPQILEDFKVEVQENNDEVDIYNANVDEYDEKMDKRRRAIRLRLAEIVEIERYY